MAPVEVRPTPPPGFVLDTPGYFPTPPPGFALDTETAAEKVLGGEIGQVIGRPPRELEEKPGLGYIAKETAKGTAEDIKTALKSTFRQGPGQVIEGIKRAKEKIEEPEFRQAITENHLGE